MQESEILIRFTIDSIEIDICSPGSSNLFMNDLPREQGQFDMSAALSNIQQQQNGIITNQSSPEQIHLETPSEISGLQIWSYKTSVAGFAVQPVTKIDEVHGEPYVRRVEVHSRSTIVQTCSVDIIQILKSLR